MEKRRKGSTGEHYNVILVEEIRSQMQLVIEGMQTTETRLLREMSEMRKELKGEILLNQQAIQAVQTGLKHEMSAMEERLAKRIDAYNESIIDHENRISVLENSRM